MPEISEVREGARLVGGRRRNSDFLAQVVSGLRRKPKRLPCKYFYDDSGINLFSAITKTPEYYPTRVETALLTEHARLLSAIVGAHATVVELGGCETTKVRPLLDELQCPDAYLPVDICLPELLREASRLSRDYPGLIVRPFGTDMTTFDLRRACPDAARRSITYLFFGSTVGNFQPESAVRLLRRWGRMAASATMIIGVDLKKDPAILDAAYNDNAGLTAAFNKNLLTRINRELAGNIDLEAFVHRAFYNGRFGRVEMHLESLRRQTIEIAGQSFPLAESERVETENSYKYTVAEFHKLADLAGWTPVTVLVDARRLFSLHVLRTSGHRPPEACRHSPRRLSRLHGDSLC